MDGFLCILEGTSCTLLADDDEGGGSYEDADVFWRKLSECTHLRIHPRATDHKSVPAKINVSRLKSIHADDLEGYAFAMELFQQQKPSHRIDWTVPPLAGMHSFPQYAFWGRQIWTIPEHHRACRINSLSLGRPSAGLIALRSESPLYRGLNALYTVPLEGKPPADLKLVYCPGVEYALAELFTVLDGPGTLELDARIRLSLVPERVLPPCARLLYLQGGMELLSGLECDYVSLGESCLLRLPLFDQLGFVSDLSRKDALNPCVILDQGVNWLGIVHSLRGLENDDPIVDSYKPNQRRKEVFPENFALDEDPEPKRDPIQVHVASQAVAEQIAGLLRGNYSFMIDPSLTEPESQAPRVSIELAQRNPAICVQAMGKHVMVARPNLDSHPVMPWRPLGALVPFRPVHGPKDSREVLAVPLCALSSQVMDLWIMAQSSRSHPGRLRFPEVLGTSDHGVVFRLRGRRTLASCIDSFPPLTEDIKLQLADELICGVRYAHSKGIFRLALDSEDVLVAQPIYSIILCPTGCTHAAYRQTDDASLVRTLRHLLGEMVSDVKNDLAEGKDHASAICAIAALIKSKFSAAQAHSLFISKDGPGDLAVSGKLLAGPLDPALHRVTFDTGSKVISALSAPLPSPMYDPRLAKKHVKEHICNVLHIGDGTVIFDPGFDNPISLEQALQGTTMARTEKERKSVHILAWRVMSSIRAAFTAGWRSKQDLSSADFIVSQDLSRASLWNRFKFTSLDLPEPGFRARESMIRRLVRLYTACFSEYRRDGGDEADRLRTFISRLHSGAWSDVPEYANGDDKHLMFI